MLKTVGFFLIVLAAVSGLSLWFLRSGALASLQDGIYAAGSAFTARYASAPLEITGVAILDPSHGLPPIPFIVYKNAKGDTATKQLVFRATSSCSVGGGAVSCTPLQNYDRFFVGREVRISGLVDDNLLYVSSMVVR